jgi:hypothetical protein
VREGRIVGGRGAGAGHEREGCEQELLQGVEVFHGPGLCNAQANEIAAFCCVSRASLGEDQPVEGGSTSIHDSGSRMG